MYKICGAKGCTVPFGTLPNDPQKYCSTACLIEDNQLTGREKIHLTSWIRVNPDKTKVIEEIKTNGRPL